MKFRSGAGGDEASIFAGDLYRMYTRFFESQGWKTELISANEGSAGGYSKLVMEVNGEDVYGRLKFESGAHRVQRVPKDRISGPSTHLSSYRSSRSKAGNRRRRH